MMKTTCKAISVLGHGFRYSFLVFVTCFVLIVSWQILYPYNPLEIKDISMEKTEYVPGEKVCLFFTAEKYMDIPAIVSIEMVNGEKIEVMRYVSHNPPGSVFKRRCFVMPTSIDAGDYRLKWTGIYPVNGLRNIVKTYTTKEFKVVEE